jgi:hypothetical protein
MALQTTYNRYMSADTKQAEGNIGFGVVVSKGSADDGVLAAGTLFVGVSIRDVTLDHATADRYEDGDNVAVMTRGDIWVAVEDAVVAQTAVKYNTSTGALGSDGGTTISGAVWKTSADAGGFAICRLGGAEDVTT